jgi:hypothetical protein
MKTLLRSFPSSSWRRRTPTLSCRHHLSSEEPLRCHEPQLSPTEPFAALGENPHDPLSVLPFLPFCLVHRSTLATVLRRATVPAMAPPGFPYRATVGRARADLHLPSMDQRPGLEATYPFVCIKSMPQIAGWMTTF